jgi:hypothetical protein
MRWDCRPVKNPEAVAEEYREALSKVVERQEPAVECLPGRRSLFLG